MKNGLKWLLQIFAGCGIGLILTSAGLAGAPSIIVDETKYNFGELSETSPFSHSFVVKNGGNATLNIKDVEPT